MRRCQKPKQRETDVTQAKYVQPYEQERIAQLGRTQIDLLLSHDYARHAVTPGYE
jgi:hypothetical protein